MFIESFLLPLGPCKPWLPFGPCDPWSPFAPGLPGNPGGPDFPTGPYNIYNFKLDQQIERFVNVRRLVRSITNRDKFWIKNRINNYGHNDNNYSESLI